MMDGRISLWHECFAKRDGHCRRRPCRVWDVRRMYDVFTTKGWDISRLKRRRRMNRFKSLR